MRLNWQKGPICDGEQITLVGPGRNRRDRVGIGLWAALMSKKTTTLEGGWSDAGIRWAKNGLNNLLRLPSIITHLG